MFNSLTIKGKLSNLLKNFSQICDPLTRDSYCESVGKVRFKCEKNNNKQKKQGLALNLKQLDIGTKNTWKNTFKEVLTVGL